jgi:hypothetical protein
MQKYIVKYLIFLLFATVLSAALANEFKKEPQFNLNPESMCNIADGNIFIESTIYVKTESLLRDTALQSPSPWFVSLSCVGEICSHGILIEPKTNSRDKVYYSLENITYGKQGSSLTVVTAKYFDVMELTLTVQKYSKRIELSGSNFWGSGVCKVLVDN